MPQTKGRCIFVKSYPLCMLCFIKCSCVIINGLFKLLSNQYRNSFHTVVNFLYHRIHGLCGRYDCHVTVSTCVGAETSMSAEFPSDGVTPGLFESMYLIMNYI